MADGFKQVANKNLGKDLFFLILLFAPILTGIGIAIIIALHESLTWRLDSNGFTHFYELFKVPIIISSISIPASGLYAALFRSAQTQIQIQTQQEQNIFQNHFKHFEEFSKMMNEGFDSYDGSREKLELSFIHFRMFPHTWSGSFLVSEDISSINTYIENELCDLHEFSPEIIFKVDKVVIHALQVFNISVPDNYDVLIADYIADFMKQINHVSNFLGQPAPFSLKSVIAVQKGLTAHNKIRELSSNTYLSASLVELLTGNSYTVDRKTEPWEIDLIIANLLLFLNADQLAILAKNIELEQNSSILISRLKKISAAHLDTCHKMGMDSSNLMKILTL